MISIVIKTLNFKHVSHHKSKNLFDKFDKFTKSPWIYIQQVCIVSLLVSSITSSEEFKKNVKRGTLDDYGFPLGYNGWASSLKFSGPTANFHDKINVYTPSQYDLAHIIAAAKQAAQDVYLAQQYVNAAKEDVLFQQKLIKEREAYALIAHQKNEAAQNTLRTEAQNVVLSQQKLARVSIIFN